MEDSVLRDQLVVLLRGGEAHIKAEPALADVEYWPAKTEGVTGKMWKASVDGFFSDLEELIELVRDQTVNLAAKIPHGESQTYLREILLAADHNAYHLGQIVQTRKLLGDWPE